MKQASRTPVSTYRLQLNRDFGFADARAVVEYLACLGVTDCYSSPYFMACPGSVHGYDVCDHTRLNPELGTDEDFNAFADELTGRGMGQVLDFVPNHMSIDPRTNHHWRDVLENGPSSPHARFFDIDWEPIKPELERKVLLPILGEQYGVVLERGELQLGFREGVLFLTYHAHELPINPRMAPKVYRHGLDRLKTELGEDHPHVREFLSVITALTNMPAYTETDPERIAERQREKEVSRERLARLAAESPEIRAHIARALEAFNGEPGNPASYDLLHELLEAQPYRLAYWRTASHEINYRRFFDINDLAGLRMEDPEVFAQTHTLVAKLAATGRITGLRIDHPDGLFDPAGYFARVQAALRPAADAPPLYVVAEKILFAGETMPETWAIHGTTGYNFLNELNALFVDPAGVRSLGNIYRRFTGRTTTFADVVYESKKLIIDTAMSSELNVLAYALNRIAQSNRRSRDFTLNSLRDTLTEVIACFPVYRTYVGPEGWSPADRDTIEAAVSAARRKNPAVEPSIFDFLREVLLPRRPNDSHNSNGPPGLAVERRHGYPPVDEADYRRRLNFTMKLQQYTGPVQAKGLEDTASYRHNLLLSLNEVGGDPARPARPAEEFHQAARRRLASWPLEMLATSTHDTKLGEDVRARLHVLSELPDDWRRELTRWARINAPNRTIVHGDPAPDRNDECRFYQTLVGAWPAELLAPDQPPCGAPHELVDRLRAYMTKAIKEAKIHTSWISENRAYDEAVARFVDDSLTGSSARGFLTALVPFVARVTPLGMINSLAQLVLKIASPGVPDIYQGAELWNLSLVDPDNRRPVAFDHRRRLLDELEPLLAHLPIGDRTGAAARGPSRTRVLEAAAQLVAEWPDGRVKLYVTACGLRFRRAHAPLFLEGAYLPLEAELAVPGEVVAFARRRGSRTLIAVVPRLVARLMRAGRPLPLGAEAWRTSRVFLPPELPAGPYRHLFTGEAVRPVRHKDAAWIFVGEALQSFPVALLYREEQE